MKPSRTILEAIAREHLSIPTLETRKSDRLDFHDVSVWGVEAALKAAYDAGARAGRIPAAPALTRPTGPAHSPEPWAYRVSENCPDVWEIVAPWCESPIAEVPRWKDDDGNDSGEAEANACLMTAAPKLLAACRMVVERWERGDLVEAARACGSAIAEATIARREP